MTTTKGATLEELKAKKKEIVTGYKASMKFLKDEAHIKACREAACADLADVLLRIAETGEELG